MAEIPEPDAIDVDVITTEQKEQTVKFLAMDENELRNLAIRERLTPSLIGFVGLIISKRNLTEILIKGYNLYLEGKKFGQQMSGDYLAKLLAANGGNNFCEETDYCESKAKLKAFFDFSDTPEGRALFAAGFAAVAERASQYEGIIEQLTGFMNSAIEFAGGSIPASFVFFSIKHGLDKLCNCCGDCDGTGTIKDQPCENCDGNGFLPYQGN